MSEEQNTHAIPAGIYKGRAIAGTEQYSEPEGKAATFAVQLTLKPINKTVTTFLYFSEKAEKFSKDRLTAMGVERLDMRDNPDGTFAVVAHGIDKNEVDVEVKYEMYQGKEQMKVEVRTGGGNVVLAPAPKAQAKGWMQRVNAQLGAAPAAASTPSTAKVRL